ncbi:MAG: glutamine synthetase [Myxococcota bacterium]
MDQQTIRETFEKRGIRKVKVGGFDVDGLLRGKYISLDKFWSAADKGFGFCDVIFGWDIVDELYDNGQVTGWAQGFPDAHAKIDLGTIRFYRHEPDTAHVLCDFYDDARKPHPACPRNLLKQVVARAETSGYRPVMSAEFEFWVFQENPDSLQAKGFQDLTPVTPGMFGYSWVRSGQNAEFLHDVLDTLRDYDVDIEGIHTETGPGVYEAALRYDDALAAADKAALFKTTLKQIATRHGLAVTFMAKWNEKLPGSSGHIHQSLWDSKREENLFAEGTGLSDLAKHFLGGQVALMPELTAVMAPFVNSYKRYVPGLWAPLTASWGVENRTCALRAITGPGRSAVRIEHRQGAADINPYIAMAAALGSGLWGIEQGIDAPAPIEGDATSEDAPGRPLPRTLSAAVGALRESDAAREVLGESFVDHYARTREWEARQYQKSVTDWELRRYFEAV